MKNRRALDAALSALAAECTEEPSAGLEEVLRDAFRAEAAMKAASRKRRHLVAGIGIAAAAAWILAIVWIGTQAGKPVVSSQPKLTAQQRSSRTTQAVSSAPAPNRVITPAGTAVSVNRQAIHEPRAHTASPQIAETATDFIRLPYTDPLLPTEQADVFRVQMPEAALATYGLPVDGSRLDSKIYADLVVGQDGVPRAIRFIR